MSDPNRSPETLIVTPSTASGGASPANATRESPAAPAERPGAEDRHPDPADEVRPTEHHEPDELGRLNPKVDPMSNDNR